MVLPLILAGTAISALVGAAKALGASEKKEYARNIVKDAEGRHRDALERIEQKRKEVQACLSELGALKLSIESNQLLLFSKVYGDIKKHSLKHVGSNQEFIPIATQELLKIQLEGEKIEEMVATGVTALAAGAATAAGATSLVGALGTVATTGTAISTLTGAAASNATLAWLGGGSLAAGGAGVAGGMMALGGLVAGPAFLIMGFSAAANAEKMFDQAVEYRKKVDGYIKQLEEGMVYLEKVKQRVEHLSLATSSVAVNIVPIIDAAKEMMSRRKSEFLQLSWVDRNLKRINPLSVKQFSEHEKILVESLNHHGMLLYALVKIPVFINGDVLNQEHEDILSLTPALLESQQQYPIYSRAEFLRLRSVIEAFWKRTIKPGIHWLTKIVIAIFLLFVLLMVIGFCSENKQAEPISARQDSPPSPQDPVTTMPEADVSQQSTPAADMAQTPSDVNNPPDSSVASNDNDVNPMTSSTKVSDVVGVWRGELYFGQGQLKITRVNDNKYLASVDIAGKNGCQGHIDNMEGRAGDGRYYFSRIVDAKENMECTLMVDIRGDEAGIQDNGCDSFHGPECPFAGGLKRVSEP